MQVWQHEDFRCEVIITPNSRQPVMKLIRQFLFGITNHSTDEKTALFPELAPP